MIRKLFSLKTQESIDHKISPILVVAFNRAESTRKVIEALIAAGIKEIYFAVDGPRPAVDFDNFRVSEVLNLVSEYSDRVNFITLIREENLGCRLAVTGAINWFFSKVDSGIILEDDCVPSGDFLIFASRMLNKYSDNHSIMHVGGSSYIDEKNEYPYNHYFTSFHEVWGWATWARAWSLFQLDIGASDTQEDKMISAHFKSKRASLWFKQYLIQARGELPSVWSTQWSLAIIRNLGLAVNPINNLVKNIGFGEDSTHGSSKSFELYDDFLVSKLSLLPDPPSIEINYQLDKMRFRVIRKTDPSLFFVTRFRVGFRTFLILKLPQKVILNIRKVKKFFKG